MKKIVSLLLAVLMLAAMLTVFAVPAFADEEPIECVPVLSRVNILSAGNYIIKQDCTLTRLGVTNKDCTLAIPEGVTVTVTTDAIIFGTVELNGTLDVSACSEFLGENNINIGETGTFIKKDSDGETETPIQKGSDGETRTPIQEGSHGWTEVLTKRDSDDQPTVSENPASGLATIFSEGNIWIIAIIAVVVIAGIAAHAIVKKKKKPAFAEGEVAVADNTEKTEE